MRVRNREIRRVQIQVKDTLSKEVRTKSFTVYNSSVDDVYNRIQSMFEVLENVETNDPVIIKHFNYKKLKEQTI